MTYIIENNYSVLNNYTYQGKSSFMSNLDWLSTPCRRVFGGRNVCVLSQTFEYPMSKQKRITTLFFSVLIFPIAIVSGASLLIKMAFIPWKWEAKIIKTQSQDVWKVINQFNDDFKNGQYDSAIKVFFQQTMILKRTEIYDTLFKCINLKINQHSPWEEIQPALRYMNAVDVIELINWAVKTRLADELQKGQCLLAAQPIINLIQRSLRLTLCNIESCYKKILSHLKIDMTQDLIFNALKMDLAHNLIQYLTELKINQATDAYGKMKPKLDEIQLYYSIFTKGQNYSDLYFIIKNDESMKQVGAEIQNIRNINEMGSQLLRQLEFLFAQENLSQELLKKVSLECSQFLESLKASKFDEQTQYIESISEIVKSIIHLKELRLNSSSNEKLESQSQVLDANIVKFQENIRDLSADTKISYSQTTLNNLLSTLRMKKRSFLVEITQKMTSLLTKN